MQKVPPQTPKYRLEILVYKSKFPLLTSWFYYIKKFINMIFDLFEENSELARLHIILEADLNFFIDATFQERTFFISKISSVKILESWWGAALCELPKKSKKPIFQETVSSKAFSTFLVFQYKSIFKMLLFDKSLFFWIPLAYIAFWNGFSQIFTFFTSFW